MSETLLSIGPTHGAVKVVLKNIGPYRSVDVTRLLFTFEVTTKQQAVVDYQLLPTGRVEVLKLPGHTAQYLASFLAQPQPIVLPQVGTEHTPQLTLEVSERQLQPIEENRTAGLQLYIHLSGYAVQDGQYLTVTETQIVRNISQSDWIDLLQQAGYRRPLLLELGAPDPQAHPDLAHAIDFFLQAQSRYLEGEWRLTVESLRQSRAALVGKKADDEEHEEDVQSSIKAQRNEAHSVVVAYEPRLELVRQAAKFMCDLGAHPETAETRRPHAYGPLVMVGGLLHASTRSDDQHCIKVDSRCEELRRPMNGDDPSRISVKEQLLRQMPVTV
jgi:hypothetical protein